MLDTNAWVALRRGHPTVSRLVRDSEELAVSMVVAGELLFGFRNGSRFEQNLDDLEDFLGQPLVTLLPVTLATADRFGRVAAGLKRAGRPIPTNDVWIAAHAFESGAELLTFDRHFEHVEGLALRLLKA